MLLPLVIKTFGDNMFGLFAKKKKPQTALDSFIFAVYGNPPPPKRADVSEAVSLAAGELLAGNVDEASVRQQALELSSGPIPYSTQDLAIAVALNFFRQPELVPRLGAAQLGARFSALQWLQQGLAVPVLVKNFEDTLYKLYKPA